MSAIIEQLGADGERSETVSVGDRSTPVSLKVYQDVYHQVTGRTEQIRKRYSENILVDFACLEQLHHKISQLCDVHRIVANNEIISIFHDKERKEQFTSFERLKAYNANSTSPTVTVVFKYNFSIVPAGLIQPQEYVVTVKLTSRVALAQQMQREAPPFIHSTLLGFLLDNTAEITIDYADYVIARGFLEAFDEWMAGCRCSPQKKWLKSMRRWSHFVPDILSTALILILCGFALDSIPDILGITYNATSGARFFLVYSTAAFVAYKLMGLAGSLIESSIDSYPILSYLNLNRGDVALIEEFEARSKSVFLQFIFGFVLAIITGIITSKIEKLI